MKRKKSKLGVALENAIFFMLITFTLCTLLATVVLIGNNYTRLSQNAFLDRVALAQIVETGGVGETYGDYTLVKDETDQTLLIIKKGETPVLYFRKDASGNITYRGEQRPPEPRID